MTFDIPWNVWAPIYAEILEDFGFDRNEDERSRDLLETRCTSRHLTPRDLPTADEAVVGIAGGASTLEDELDRIDDVDLLFAASTATNVLETHGTVPDLHVTDLDKDEELTVRRTHDNDPVVLHAHGDNRTALNEYVPTMETEYVLPTSQARPTSVVRNPGGFTDGDRAAFLAHTLGADAIVFLGWDFDDPSVGQEKRKKLRWAARLLHWLEQEREERFDVLDGLRGTVQEL